MSKRACPRAAAAQGPPVSFLSPWDPSFLHPHFCNKNGRKLGTGGKQNPRIGTEPRGETAQGGAALFCCLEKEEDGPNLSCSWHSIGYQLIPLSSPLVSLPQSLLCEKKGKAQSQGRLDWGASPPLPDASASDPELGKTGRNANGDLPPPAGGPTATTMPRQTNYSMRNFLRKANLSDTLGISAGSTKFPEAAPSSTPARSSAARAARGSNSPNLPCFTHPLRTGGLTLSSPRQPKHRTGCAERRQRAEPPPLCEDPQT